MVITLLLLIVGMRCSEELNLYHTWKFEGFANVKNNSFKMQTLQTVKIAI